MESQNITIEQSIFEKVAYLSNKENDEFQIEEHTDDEINIKYRLYHKVGICVDVSMIYDEDQDEYEYIINQSFDGFKVLKNSTINKLLIHTK